MAIRDWDLAECFERIFLERRLRAEFLQRVFGERVIERGGSGFSGAGSREMRPSADCEEIGRGI